MTNRIKIALLYGGKSGEHEISLISACSVLKALDKTKYDVFPIAIDKKGCTYLHQLDVALGSETALPVYHDAAIELPSLLVNGKFVIDIDVVFPVMHGPLYEDGAIQGLLTLANVAFVGCDVLASAVGMDKDISRRLVSDGIDIKCAPYQVITSHVQGDDLMTQLQQLEKKFSYPMFVKPLYLGSSVGISKVHSKDALMKAVKLARDYDSTIIIEKMVHGREIELAVLENIRANDKPFVSVPGEICVHHQDGFYSYAAKYLESEKTDLVIPASLSQTMINKLQQSAAFIFSRLKCSGLARIDFFIEDKTDAIYFSEINTLPGFTSISMYTKLWEATGLSYVSILDSLIELGIARFEKRQALITDYQ